MKQQAVIKLESTRRYVRDDPEDAESVYDICDELGPWDSLDGGEKSRAPDDLSWRDVNADDKQQFIGEA